MIMKNTFSSLFLLAIIFTSCKKEEVNTPPTAVIPFTQMAPTDTTTTTSDNQSVMSTQVQQNPEVVNQNKITTTPAPLTVKKGMNPPHGQPLHRCDIPVGAPLNSPINTTQKTANSTTATQTSTNNVPALLATPTPEGMNPPHGQDGHRCDIAVGAPLPKE